MATFYYRNAPATDGDWNSLGNWWMSYNAGTDTLSVPATSLPGANDDVVLLGTEHWAVSKNTGPVPTVRNVTVESGGLTINIVATGVIKVQGSGALFNDGNYGDGWLSPGLPPGYAASITITGNVEFYDSTYLFFNGSWSSGEIIDGNVTMYDYSYVWTGAYGNITGRLEFRDHSFSSAYYPAQAPTPGGVWFYDDSHSEYNLTTPGTAFTFNDRSYNNGDVGVYSWEENDFLTPSITFNDSSWSYSGAALNATTVTFNHNSYGLMSALSGGGVQSTNVIFNDSSHSGDWQHPAGDYMTVSLGNVTYRHSSWNEIPVTVSSYDGYTVTYTDRTPYPIPRGINGSSILGVV